MIDGIIDIERNETIGRDPLFGGAENVVDTTFPGPPASAEDGGSAAI